MRSSTTVTVRHATPSSRIRSILATGLDPSFATGKLKVCWLHQPRKSKWARTHVSHRHNTPEQQVALLEMRLPLADLRRRSDGVWTCDRIIRPDEFTSINGLKLYNPA